MSEKEKALISETVENMKHLNEESLLLLKSNSEVLKARDALDKKEKGDVSEMHKEL